MQLAIPSDHSLLRRFRDTRVDASMRLYRRYAKRLQLVAARQISPALFGCVDPEDVVQSVFCDFFKGAAEGRYDVPEGEEIWKLLLVMTRNKVRAVGNFHRAARRDMRRTVGGKAYDTASESVSVQDESAATVLRMVIDVALETLPAGHGSIIEMRIEGY
jgi:hypothetical protein